MRNRLRRSLPSRIVAASFIVLILIGNFWLVLALTGKAVPAWMRVTVAASIGTALVGGVALLALALLHRFVPALAGPEEIAPSAEADL